MLSFFKKKKIIPHIKLSGVIGNVGKFKQGIDFAGQEEIIKKAFSIKKAPAIAISINSPGGSVTCGIAVYDAMNYVQSSVTTICVGTAASMASFILAGGDTGKRIALPYSRIMIHQPEGGSQGQASEVLSESEEVMRIRRQVGQIYAQRTGQPLSRISRDMDRDQFMSSEEAKVYGLVDQVAVDTKWSQNS